MFSLKIALLSIMVTLSFAAKCPYKNGPMDSTSVQTVLNEALTKVAASADLHYTIDNITSGTAYGSCWFVSRYEVVASLTKSGGKSNNCNVIIWKNNWRSFGNALTTVVFDCLNESQVIGTYHDD